MLVVSSYKYIPLCACNGTPAAPSPMSSGTEFIAVYVRLVLRREPGALSFPHSPLPRYTSLKYRINSFLLGGWKNGLCVLLTSRQKSGVYSTAFPARPPLLSPSAWAISISEQGWTEGDTMLYTPVRQDELRFFW